MKKTNGRKNSISAIKNWWSFIQTGLNYYTFKTIVKSFLPKRKHESKSLYPTDLVHLIKMKYRIHMREMLWLSLGENCLTDIILHRHGVKSLSTPYSHGRSNIDYALALEKNRYHGLLDFENLHYAHVTGTKVVKSLCTNKCDDIYDEMHMRGFEFTHHDVIASQKDRDSMQRKISRLQTLKGKKNFVFFYHHRANVRSDIEMIFEKAQKFTEYYSLQGKTCHMVIFSQKIIHDHSERKLEYKKIDPTMHYFIFSVQYYWRGERFEDENSSLKKNQIDFFAIDDDDLMKKMIRTVRDILLDDKNTQDGIM